MAPSDPITRSRVVTPLRVHLLTLVGVAVFLVLSSRGQWFFYDEWDFLRDPGNPALLLEPHVGHLSAAPILVVAALKGVFGLATYWPYLVLAFAAHLGLAHVLWRIMIRVGVEGWTAVVLALVFMLYAGGGENIFWAFQLGYMGAIAIALTAALVADGLTSENYRRRFAPIVLLVVLSVSFAGTALPIMIVTALVAWRRVGFLRAAVLMIIPTALYGAWYVYQAATFTDVSLPGATVAQILAPEGMALFAGAMLEGATDRLAPVPFLGLAILVAVAVYFFCTLRSAWRRRVLMLGMVCAAVAFALLTAYSRINSTGVAGAQGGRYLYMVLAMLLPLIGVAATALVARSRWLHGIVLIGGVVIAVYGAFTLHEAARVQSQVEAYTQDVLMGAIRVASADPQLPASAVPDPIWAPTLTLGDLKSFVDDGSLPVRPPTLPGILTASANLESHTEADADAAGCEATDATTVAVDADGLVVEVPEALHLRLFVSEETTIGADQILTLQPGATRISYTGDGVAQVRIDDTIRGLIELCD